jgi:hypothetical protein
MQLLKHGKKQKQKARKQIDVVFAQIERRVAFISVTLGIFNTTQ